jgi:hypothetical protein
MLCWAAIRLPERWLKKRHHQHDQILHKFEIWQQPKNFDLQTLAEKMDFTKQKSQTNQPILRAYTTDHEQN